MNVLHHNMFHCGFLNKIHHPSLISWVYFKQKAATIFKIRLSLMEKAKDFLMCHRCENAVEGQGNPVNHEI